MRAAIRTFVAADGNAATAPSDTLELTEDNVEKVLDEVSPPPGPTQDQSPCSAEPARFPGGASGVRRSLTPCVPAGHLQVRPYLMADGGNVELAEIDGLVVKLKLNGACGSCPSRRGSAPRGILRALRPAGQHRALVLRFGVSVLGWPPSAAAQHDDDEDGHRAPPQGAHP